MKTPTSRTPSLVFSLIVVSMVPFTEAFASQVQRVQGGAIVYESDADQWTQFETELTSSRVYENPVQEVRVQVEFTAPSGKRRTVLAFWDGGKTWRVRFSPDETGRWSYQTSCSQQSDKGLHDRSGEFVCGPYLRSNPLYRHGEIRLSENRRYLVQADGTPFFWLSDTVWNGALLSDEKGWDTYLQDRVDKGFTAIQFVMTQWRTATGDAEGRPAFTGKERVSINPEFFQRMDHRIDAVNEHGLIAAPVLLWAIRGEENPGYFLPEDQKIVMTEYMVARYGAHQVIWMLGGDGEYRGEKAETWKRVGRAVFGQDHHRLATMHPNGRSWVGDEFRGEPWFSFIGYQSGHGDDDKTFRWLTQGPPSREWNREPMLPVINLEPNYEAHNGYTFRKFHDDHSVRRAAYWSLLVSPTAGLTYGGQGVWGWHQKVRLPVAHKGTGLGLPWYEAIHLPGSTHMKRMKDFFTAIDWWRLVPAQEMLVQQPGEKDAKLFIAAAKSDNGDLAVAYLPEGGDITLQTESLKRRAAARWFHPFTGGWLEAGSVDQSAQEFTAPDRNDWVLCIEAKE